MFSTLECVDNFRLYKNFRLRSAQGKTNIQVKLSNDAYMKKELRGRKTKDYSINYITDLKQLFNSNHCTEMSNEDIKKLHKEWGCNVLPTSNKEDVVMKIRESILKLYNNDITGTVMHIYCFLNWYKCSLTKLEKLNKLEERNRLLNFESVIDGEILNKLDVLLQKYDKDDVNEYIMYAQYMLISIIKKRMIVNSESAISKQLKHNICATCNNCKFLGLINDNLEVDNYYILKWEYYPVDKVFRNVIDTFNSELSLQDYLELKGKEFYYFTKIKNAEVDFSSIKSLFLTKDGKQREVYLATKSIDQAALKYLSKRLNSEFHITYPNRDKIMEISFNLIDSLTRLDDYTIFKFDFKDFFGSVKIKRVYDKYIEHSNLLSYEKDLLLILEKKFKYCVQGLPISNTLIEIISRDFDDRIKAEFSDDGLVFYKRYVDDCILIFNHRIKKEKLRNVVEKCRVSVFGKGVLISLSKTYYQTKLDGDDSFDYLGYSFMRRYWNNAKKQDAYYYYEFGIAKKKIEKYKKQLDEIFKDYEINNNDCLLLRRIQYYNSRIVFYNYNGSKYVNKRIWDVRGIINSYRMLRRYIIYDTRNIKDGKAGNKVPYRIQKDTYEFLQYYVKEKRNSLPIVPQYLRGKGCYNHTLWNGFIKNKSIVFQPNIGWSSDLLSDRLMEVGKFTLHKSYYERTRDYYSAIMIKKL